MMTKQVISKTSTNTCIRLNKKAVFADGFFYYLDFKAKCLHDIHGLHKRSGKERQDEGQPGPMSQNCNYKGSS